jgi:TPR repeat protein
MRTYAAKNLSAILLFLMCTQALMANDYNVKKMIQELMIENELKHQQLLEKGDASAQTEEGKRNEDKRDLKSALEWYEKAALQNHPEAIRNLGQLYEHGSGVLQNYETAKYYYEKSANMGNSRAAHNIGLLYEKGLGVKANEKEALAWHKIAAEDNYYKLYLGDFYANDSKTPNYKLAYALYNAAAIDNSEYVSHRGKTARDTLQRKMTQEQIMEGQLLSKKLVEINDLRKTLALF